MKCPNCKEPIEQVFEAHARRVCPNCDTPLHEKPA
jgi:Zn finger protein HypA/HybF involved in hydrogenase expression